MVLETPVNSGQIMLFRGEASSPQIHHNNLQEERGKRKLALVPFNYTRIKRFCRPIFDSSFAPRAPFIIGCKGYPIDETEKAKR